MDLQGRTALVMGMGRSGAAALTLLRQRGARAYASDQRELKQLGAAADAVEALAEGYVPQHSLAGKDLAALGVSLVVIAPGVPADLPLLQQARAGGIDVMGEVELAAAYLRGPVLGITGTNGKTTTTALTGHLLQCAGIPAQVGGNIGTPVCGMVDSSAPEQWNVLELSSFQLETTRSLAARIAVCLNVTPDHLDRHHTLDNYVAAKRRLFELQSADGTAVLNADNPATLRFGFAGPAAARLFTITNDPRRQMWLDGDALMCEGQLLLRRQQIPLPGLHNVENVMAASLAALSAGAAPEAVVRGVGSFPGVEHRLEFVRERDGVRWYNDSKATNVDAALKAIASFDAPLWILLGGRDKHSDYRPLADALRGKIRRALLVGEAANLIHQQIGAELPCQHCESIQRAVQVAAQESQAGDVVLLAPACASFDQFSSYEERGRHFKQLVLAIDHHTGASTESRGAE
ncbi:MAG: UDP-N-acetylmuramoyl-L-alanine--D-glutamate ligase [Bryobacterales bacterium]|jgi:UDP-N-acetylmuramoylalanine--D-glutamate ligase|nr:UDP-N-acetylmuramoyl-L-alanine--D-glutamate ligase [Bryobacterales bacterium]